MFAIIFMVLLCNINCDIINTKVIRTIDIKTQLVKINSVITIQNKGLTYVKNYLYIVDPGVDHFFLKFENEWGTELLYEEVPIIYKGSQNLNHYKVSLDIRLLRNETYNIKAEIVYINQIIPLYKTLTFTQDQFVMYTGNLLYYSAYKTLLLVTTYMWEKVEYLEISHPPHQQQLNNFTYFYESVAPLSFEEMKMEFKNNNPFLVVTYLERIIDVSHYGKISIEDQVAIKNEGSKLVGPYEHRLSALEVAASNWWHTHLPASVENIEFFDVIGNSTKSVLLHYQNYKTFKFQPRYPLLNGWKTFYIIRYRVPTYEYLYHNSQEDFVLKMRAVDHILNDVVIRKAVVKVLLPEAARVIKVEVPNGFERLENEKHYTALSTFGRPTIVFNCSYIVENHIADFTIEYVFPSFYLARVPLMIILYLQSIFICFILVSRSKQ